MPFGHDSMCLQECRDSEYSMALARNVLEKWELEILFRTARQPKLIKGGSGAYCSGLAILCRHGVVLKLKTPDCEKQFAMSLPMKRGHPMTLVSGHARYERSVDQFDKLVDPIWAIKWLVLAFGDWNKRSDQGPADRWLLADLVRRTDKRERWNQSIVQGPVSYFD